VLRAHLSEAKFCYTHPHRAVLTACARCKTPYCAECIETRDTGLYAKIVAKDERKPVPLFCDRCIEEIDALEAMQAYKRRPLRQKLRPTRAGFQRVAIWMAVIAVLMVPMSIAVRSMAETTLTPEELHRIRLGLTGGFLTPDGINLVTDAFGGRFVRASAPSPTDHQPTRLIDGWAAVDVPSWRSADTQLPVDLVFSLRERTTINNVILRPHPSEPPAARVRDFEVLVSLDAPDSGFTSVYAGALPSSIERPPEAAGSEADPKFRFPDAAARYIMLRVHSTHGAGPYASLAEFEVYWTRPERK